VRSLTAEINSFVETGGQLNFLPEKKINVPAKNKINSDKFTHATTNQFGLKIHCGRERYM